MKLRSVETIGEVRGKTVLVRVDFNIDPQALNDEESQMRIKAALPTLQFLRKNGAEIILLTHLGRPKKKEPELSTKQLVPILEKLLKESVIFFDDLKKFEKTRQAKTHFYLFQNLRFFSGEETNDIQLATRLAALADLYVNEAFSVSHRAHTSIVALARLLPAYAGFAMEKEVMELSKVMHEPKHPLVLLLGGAKVDTKAAVIEQFVDKAEAILLAGALPNPFWSLLGKNIGRSRVTLEELDVAKRMQKYENIILPADLVTTKNMAREVGVLKTIDELVSTDYLVDIGPETIKKFAIILKQAQTIIWNGPPGIFEHQPFSYGTTSLARIIAARAKGKAYAVVGGGETVTALYQSGVANDIDHISTGGGSMLEFLGGKTLPGLEPLKIEEE